MVNETYHPRGALVHGYRPREHPIYFVWVMMKYRCRVETCPQYGDYGGRGIDYCDRWKHFRFFARIVISLSVICRTPHFWKPRMSRRRRPLLI